MADDRRVSARGQDPAPAFRIEFASADQRNDIYRMRHDVYAVELGQHPINREGRLTDELDAFNHYLAVTRNGHVTGFVAVTPPGHGQYSIDKYVPRESLPFTVDDGLFEVRILTVDAAHRGGPVAGLLMYAALRWVEDHGATRMVIIGRSEVAGLYERAGLHRLGRTIRSGAVSYELMSATIEEIRVGLSRFRRLLGRLHGRVEWTLTVPFERGPGAFHGGASHAALGAWPSPQQLDDVIAADVLDAWFEPAPAVIRALSSDPASLAATSPTTFPTELRDAIADTYGVTPDSIALGAGLSDLIYRCIPRWIDRSARIALIEPQYGEYRHVLGEHVGCRIESIWLNPEEDPAPTKVLSPIVEGGHEWLFIVDTNNPVGYRLDPGSLIAALTRVPPTTRVWIDRTYAPYSMASSGLERFAAASPNVVVATSMSKAWALSGLRVGFLCGPPDLIADAWRATPPWNVSRPAQIGALAALGDPGYYADRYRATAVLRDELRAGLSTIAGVRARDGHANFAFCELDPPLDASTIVERSAARGLYVRDFPADARLRSRALRISVKDRATQQRMLELLSDAVNETRAARAAGRPTRSEVVPHPVATT